MYRGSGAGLTRSLYWECIRLDEKLATCCSIAEACLLVSGETAARRGRISAARDTDLQGVETARFAAAGEFRWILLGMDEKWNVEFM